MRDHIHTSHIIDRNSIENWKSCWIGIEPAESFPVCKADVWTLRWFEKDSLFLVVQCIVSILVWFGVRQTWDRVAWQSYDKRAYLSDCGYLFIAILCLHTIPKPKSLYIIQQQANTWSTFATSYYVNASAKFTQNNKRKCETAESVPM